MRLKTSLSQTIFVLEDDSDISRLVQHHLEAAGFGARVYANPSNVIADAERQPPPSSCWTSWYLEEMAWMSAAGSGTMPL